MITIRSRRIQHATWIGVVSILALPGIAGAYRSRQRSHSPDTEESPRVFYVDSLSGSDSSDGLARDRAWKTLGPVNAAVFEPGDRILLRAGTAYRGRLEPHGSGTLSAGRPNPIVIGSYGEGPRPRIDGEGRYEAALFLHNVEFWEVNGLELTNHGATRKAKRKGVYVLIEDFGTAHHIQLKDLYIHDVNGTTRKADGASGGIRWRTSGKSKRSRLNGFLIEGCRIVRCERDGIMGSGPVRRGVDWYPSLNVVIRNNLIQEVPGDGIVPIACDGAIVERNVMANGTRLLPHSDAAAGIWPWGSDNTVIQFNEVSGHKAPWDAQGFDSDWNCRNTVIQYNYSHDNEGGFLLICNNGGAGESIAINTGTIVRYNISINDGLRTRKTRKGTYFSPIFHISGPVKDTKIYNNLIYVPAKPDPKIDRTMIKMDNWGGPWPEDTWFANNIFYVTEETNYDWGESRNHVFERNLYVGVHRNGPVDLDPIREEPLFVSPGHPGSGLDSLNGFQLRPNSPCIGAGISISGSGGRDFWGNAVPDGQAVTIGVHQFNSD